METAVYLFTGFLDAGKTTFIRDTLRDPNFNDGKRTYLIVSCEDGEEELDPTDFGPNVKFATFEDEASLSPDRLNALKKRAGADILIVEYNGMWTLDSFYNAIPEDWLVYQEIFIADSTTILTYNANMRQQTVDKLTSCEMVVFNRVSDKTDKMELHKLVRGISRKANICYEDTAGEIEFDEIEDPLPFDINAPVIIINDEDYALWYRDVTEEPQKYAGKTVEFKAQVALLRRKQDGMFGPGRFVMTCCADDIQFCGVPCAYDKISELESRSWIMLKATIRAERHPIYAGEIGPVLTALSVEIGRAHV